MATHSVLSAPQAEVEQRRLAPDAASGARRPEVEPYPQAPVVLADDEELVLESMESVLRLAGITNVLTTTSGDLVEELVERHGACLVFLDLAMPGVSGQELLRRLRPRYPDLAIVMVTGTMEVATVVSCVKAGATDYLVKPVEPSRLVTTARRAVETWDLRRENEALSHRLVSPELDCPEAFAHIVTASPRMKTLMLYVDAVAKSSRTVLITGPTGAGKELFAQAVHRASGRGGELVTANVAGLDDGMFADALFGHARGAFTGADRARTGLVESAAGGTLFLDEIGDLPEASQLKLLRLVETGEYYPLGVDTPRKSSARIVAASNRDLRDLVASGKFRRDLYFRLRTHEVIVPALAERPEDIPLLVEHFVREACAELGKRRPTIPPELYALLGAYHFPGNVRELKSMVVEAVSLHDTPAGGRGGQPGPSRRRPGVLPLSVFRQRVAPEGDSPVSVAPPVVFAPQLPTLRQVTELLVAEALRRAGDNQTVAARLLGISQQALSKRLSRRRRAASGADGNSVSV